MANTTEERMDPDRVQAKTSLINNPKFRSFIYQAILVGSLVAFVAWLWGNAATNLAAQGRATGFFFLNQSSGFNISFSLIPFDRASSYLTVYFVGILNTLLVAAIGVVLATLLGFTVGVARLSKNALVRGFSAVYVEMARNVPLLLQLIFWYFLMLNALPVVREAWELPGGIIVNRRGVSMPQPILDERFVFVALIAVIAIIGAVIWRKRALRRVEETGERRPIWLPFLGIVIVPTVIAFFASGTQVTFSMPELTGFNYTGGWTAPPELTALILGLVLYTAAFIAEIVRAGIQAVNYGQTEAAAALGLKESDRLNLVIIPQAMRVIVPPLTSQYLNLTKNSSLGAAIGFPELVNVFVGTALNQSGRAIEIIGMTMLVYLTFSLITSIFMNWYNARVALVER